ncbi:hypothetical protein AB0174_23585 [Klebsiella quasipneumoniae]|uniref:hypothetical protein n=1 Tax=Klebsiella quasipneumoniae TaxID=1463165 RepID=UPI00069E6617|nr:hypothetical protein [Klebsiella quasipneumoniae]MDG5015193.1 hypothetical protein [Klebsiella quasipneumoniae]
MPIQLFTQTFRDKLAAVIRLDTYWQVLIQHPYFFHYADHILAFQLYSGMVSLTLTTKNIHYSHRHEIHTPALIDVRQTRALLVKYGTEMLTGAFSAQIQPYRAINPVCLIFVNFPAFPL